MPSDSDVVWPLMAGTFVIGAAIAVGNVLLPVIVRRDFPGQVPRVTGYYIAVQSIVAGLASGFVVPVSLFTGFWRIALAVWRALILVALVWWLRRLLADARRGGVTAGATPSVPAVSVWRAPLAWQVAGYFGVQSTSFYVLLSWLPTVEQDMGFSPTVAGAHLSLYLVVGVVANLALPPFLTLRGDQRIAAVVVAAWLIGAMAGLLVMPSLTVIWVALSGLGVGASMVLSLSLISLRAGGGSATSRLSSMVQAVAYAGVAGGLFVAGWIREAAGPGQDVLLYVLALSVVQAMLGLRVGRAAQLSVSNE
jgi:CP family cyanate transporter-like MFS transporter